MQSPDEVRSNMAASLRLGQQQDDMDDAHHSHPNSGQVQVRGWGFDTHSDSGQQQYPALLSSL
jgi:hypothetical protein